MLVVKGAPEVAATNEPKKSDEKEKERSSEGRRREKRKKNKISREKLRDGTTVRSEAFS